MENEDFADWLNAVITERGITQAKLKRKSGLSPAQISRVLNKLSPPGIEFCQAIARTLDLPEIFVFSKAGLLTPIEYDEVSEEFRIILHELSAAGKRDLMQIAHMILRWESKID